MDMPTKETTYYPALDRLKAVCRDLPRTRMMATARLDALVILALEIEKLLVDPTVAEHPFPIAAAHIERAAEQIAAWASVGFADGGEEIPDDPYNDLMEEMHRDLFQLLWTQFNADEYKERISRYEKRLQDNDLSNGFLDGMRCLDMGCGHGNFGHALLAGGAGHVVGIDVGMGSLRYAKSARDRLGVGPDRFSLVLANVKKAPYPDESFDLVLQNGVFHHVDDEDAAYREMARLTKPGGWAWVYNEGEGSIGRDVFAACVEIVADIPAHLVVQHFKHIGLNTGKRYHLSDGFNAIYRPATWESLTDKLRKLGYVEFIRLKGSYPTDYDITNDHRFSAEKFGEGDLRILAKKG
ncbi:MAG: class I SAM-dependent methyltransferase [Alphaproteobacteria bacterium]